MASPLQNKSRTDPVSGDELETAKEAFIVERTSELLEKYTLDVFLELNGGEGEYLRKLMTGSILELIVLQDKFRIRMQHEALALAERQWTPSMEAFASLGIQDGRGSE
jgi:hypothetical protein